MVTINHKRGDTLELKCSVPLAFGQSLTTTSSQVRYNSALIESLTFTVGTPTATDYIYTLSATKEQTILWPVGLLLVDIQYLIGAKAASTDTFALNIIEDVTV